MTWFLHFVPNLPNWLLSTPFDLIFAFCTKLTPFKTIWPDFYTVYPIYPIDSFQDHFTWFLHSVPNWLLSRPHDLIISLCTLIIPFKTIWSNFVIVHPIDCSQYHFVWFFYCVHNWLLSRPFDLFLLMCSHWKGSSWWLGCVRYVENALIISSETYKEVLTQLVSTSNKRPSSGEMKNDLKRVGIYTENDLTL